MRHCRSFSVLIQVLLLVGSIGSYILLLILFIKPSAYKLDSLIYPDDATGFINPQVAVGLITALLTPSTSALITRSVKHSLWRKLSPLPIQRKLTIGEAHRLAEWSVSPSTRFLYLFSGSSWLLKIAGLLLLGVAIVNSVLLSGISQSRNVITSSAVQAAQGSQWDGRIDLANVRYNGGMMSDVRGLGAYLTSLNNLTAPIAPVCPATFQGNCTVSTFASALRADCTPSRFPNPDLIGSYSQKQTYRQYCSTRNPVVCVSLAAGSPSINANFTGGVPACRSGLTTENCPGEFVTIFGAYMMNPYNSSSLYSHDLNTVDCSITFGNVAIRQNGTAPPTLERSSFVKSKDNLPGQLSTMRRIYTEDNAASSPYTFTGSSTPDSSNNLFKSALGTLLLSTTSQVDASIVASRIESAFDMSTLFAFSRSPTSSTLNFAFESANKARYTYDKKVLFILLIPLLATLLGCWGRGWVGGIEVIGYDVVGIATMGPVGGLEKYEQGSEIEERPVWCEKSGNGRRLFAGA